MDGNLAFNGDNTRNKLQVDTKYLNEKNINSLFLFGEDEKTNLEKIEVNNIFKPTLIMYYNKEVQKW